MECIWTEKKSTNGEKERIFWGKGVPGKEKKKRKEILCVQLYSGQGGNDGYQIRVASLVREGRKNQTSPSSGSWARGARHYGTLQRSTERGSKMSES